MGLMMVLIPFLKGDRVNRGCQDGNVMRMLKSSWARLTGGMEVPGSRDQISINYYLESQVNQTG